VLGTRGAIIKPRMVRKQASCWEAGQSELEHHCPPVTLARCLPGVVCAVHASRRVQGSERPQAPRLQTSRAGVRTHARHETCGYGFRATAPAFSYTAPLPLKRDPAPPTWPSKQRLEMSWCTSGVWGSLLLRRCLRARQGVAGAGGGLFALFPPHSRGTGC